MIWMSIIETDKVVLEVLAEQIVLAYLKARAKPPHGEVLSA